MHERPLDLVRGLCIQAVPRVFHRAFSSYGVVQLELGVSNTINVLLDGIRRDELDYFDFPCLTLKEQREVSGHVMSQNEAAHTHDTVGAICRLSVVVGWRWDEPAILQPQWTRRLTIEILVKDAHHGSRNQIDAHSACFRGEKEDRDVLVFGEIVDQ